MNHSIACPHCTAALKSATPVPPGKKVTCPKCQKAFVTPGEAAEVGKAFSIQCSHCSAVLKSATPVPAGKPVKCPKCGQTFTTPSAPAVKPAPAPANLNISIFTGDADLAIARLIAESAPAKLDDDLVTEEDESADGNAGPKAKA